MTQDEIIDMALLSGLVKPVFGEENGLMTVDKKWDATKIDKFVDMVIFYEREACAKVCEEMHKPEDSVYHWIPDGRGALQYAASGIRARGEK